MHVYVYGKTCISKNPPKIPVKITESVVKERTIYGKKSGFRLCRL